MITCELRFLLTDSRLACEDAGCLTTINLKKKKEKKTGEGVGLCQTTKHLNLTHGVNHTPSPCCFITDLAWSVSNRAPQVLLLWSRIVLLLLPPLISSSCTFETLVTSHFISMFSCVPVWFGGPAFNELRSFLSQAVFGLYQRAVKASSLFSYVLWGLL